MNHDSARFGNFLHNSHKERINSKVAEQSESIWNYIMSHESEFENGFFNKSTGNDVIIPSPSIQKLIFWSRLYAKWDPRTSTNPHYAHARQLRKQMENTKL